MSEFGPGEAITGLDVLDEYAGRIDAAATTYLSHDELPKLRFLAAIPRDGQEHADLAAKAAKKEKINVDNLSAAMFNRWKLASCVQEIEVFKDDMWQRLEADGQPLNFVSSELRIRYNASGAADVVMKIIRDDGIIGALIDALLKKSNFGSDANTADPTTAR